MEVGILVFKEMVTSGVPWVERLMRPQRILVKTADSAPALWQFFLLWPCIWALNQQKTNFHTLIAENIILMISDPLSPLL